MCYYAKYIIYIIYFESAVMVEKILRAHPNVKKLYLLLRNVDQITASKHFYDEVYDCVYTHISTTKH